MLKNILKSEFTYKELLLILMPYFVFSFFTLFQGSLVEDELCHLSMVLNFKSNFWDTLFGYSYISANTPLPYLLVLLPSKLFGSDIILFRIITILYSFFSLLLFFVLIRKINPHSLFYLIFVLFFYPYYLRTSFSFYMAMYGIFFAIIAYLLLLNLDTNLSYFLAGLLSSFAILCQQYYLAIPAGFITYAIYKLVIRRSFSKYKIENILLFLLPFVIPLLLFYIWDGLTKFSSYEIKFSIWNITGVLTVVEFWFLPFTIQEIKNIKLKAFIIIGILSLILGLLFKPEWSQAYGYGYFTGIVFHSIEYFKFLSTFASLLVTTFLTFFGITCLTLILKNSNKEWDRIIKIIIFFFLLIYSFNALLGERHLIHLFIPIFALTLTKVKKQTLIVWLVFMCLIGIMYFFYWFYDIKFCF